jgi:NitT/TauT family transport system ATP-binding protein
MSPRPGRITDVVDGRRPRGSAPSAGRGVEGAHPGDAVGLAEPADSVDLSEPLGSVDVSELIDSVDDVRESAEFFAAVTEVREALRKGGT